MLKLLQSLFARQKSEPEKPEAADERIAVAALLVEAARIDEDYADAEKAIIDRALAEQFEMTPEAAASLRAQAEAAQAEAIDLHRFTKQAKQMDVGDKIRLIETMWRITLSDQNRDVYEDALIRRVCGLIYVDDRASGEARLRVEAEWAKS